MKAVISKLYQQRPWLMCIVLTTLFFLLFNIIATPLLNSGDDAYMLYTLGGGYGEAPTNLLHYNHIWHPWLGWIVKSLFVAFPSMNWYTITLSLFHIAGCSAILYVFIKKFKPAVSFLLFFILIFFVETRMLLSFTFTGAAIVAATGACCLLTDQLQRGKWRSANNIFAILLLILSGMLRLQIAELILLLFAAIAVTVHKRKELFRWGINVGLVVILLIALNKVHEQYYKKNIAGWGQQEKFRQALFYAYNRQLKPTDIFKDSTERQLYAAGFLYDSVQFGIERITQISHSITRTRSITNKEDRAGLYWFFIEMRIYILLFAVFISLLLVQKQYAVLRKWTLSLLAIIAIHSYLFIFLKMTMAIHLGLLFFLLVALFMQLKEDYSPFYRNKKISIGLAVFLVLLFGWMGVRAGKENAENISKHQRFLCMLKELNQQPGKLFIATDDAFPLDRFYIWDLPEKYPAHNLIYKDRLITHTYLPTLKRFGISDLKEALRSNKNVFLLGKALPALQNIEQPAVLSGRLPGFSCLEVRQLEIK